MRELLIKTMAPVLWIMTFFDRIAIYFMIREFRKGTVHNIPLLTGLLCI